jgi:hypothetical protein
LVPTRGLGRAYSFVVGHRSRLRDYREQRHRQRRHPGPVSPQFRRRDLRKACQPTKHLALAGICRCYVKMTSASAPALNSWPGRCARVRSRRGRAPRRSFPQNPSDSGSHVRSRARRGALWLLARRHEIKHSGREPDPSHGELVGIVGGSVADARGSQEPTALVEHPVAGTRRSLLDRTIRCS